MIQVATVYPKQARAPAPVPLAPRTVRAPHTGVALLAAHRRSEATRAMLRAMSCTV